ncbi:hypothetical protein Tco_0503344 [Tanacetum coccineum]
MEAVTEPTTYSNAVQKACTRTDEAVRMEHLRETLRREDWNAFATTANPVRREYMGGKSQLNAITQLTATRGACFESGVEPIISDQA